MITPVRLLHWCLLLGLAGLATACATPREPAVSNICGEADRTLKLGFYAHFRPISYSADESPTAPDFNVHRGYEADLLTAVEAMESPKLSFDRRGIALWDGIWLQSATPQYDVVGGGITILDSRTRDAAGREAVAFTNGHIHFRQSLLTRPEDAARLAAYADLTETVRVGVLAATTGEQRLLEITGLVDATGALAAGAAVTTPQGRLVADGSSDYTISAAVTSPNLQGRTRLYPADAGQPQVVYLGAELGEAELLAALAAGEIDAIARGEIGNRDAANTGAFAVTALDDHTEIGGFTLAAEAKELRACLNERLDWLTDQRNIGYGDWLTDPAVFMNRAHRWNEMER